MILLEKFLGSLRSYWYILSDVVLITRLYYVWTYHSVMSGCSDASTDYHLSVVHDWIMGMHPCTYCRPLIGSIRINHEANQGPGLYAYCGIEVWYIIMIKTTKKQISINLRCDFLWETSNIYVDLLLLQEENGNQRFYCHLILIK